MSQSIFDPEREPYERRAERSRFPIYLLGGLGCLFILGIVAAPFAIVFFARGVIKDAWQAQQPAPIPKVESETPEERQADLQAGFGVPQPQVDPKTLAGLTKFFDAVIESTKNNDAPGFRKTIDGRRFMQEVKKTGLVRSLTNRDEESYISDFQTRWLSLPGDWTHYQIVNVRFLDGLAEGGREAIVYLWFWSDPNYVDQVRYWVIRSHGGWKGYDWEGVEFGCRTSLDAAAFGIRYAQDPRHPDHDKARQEIAKAGSPQDETGIEAAAALLEQAERRARLPELADHQLVMLAYAWNRLGRSRDAMRCAREVKVPLAAPGALYIQALVYESWQNYRRALDFGKRYAAAGGGDPTIWQFLARNHARLGERDAAAEYWLKILEYQPDNRAALSGLAISLPEDKPDILLEKLRKTDRAADLAAGIIDDLQYSQDLSRLKFLGEFIFEQDPDSARTSNIRGLVAQADENYDEAAGFFKLAFESATDDQTRKTYVMRFLDAMSAAEKAVEGYEQAPDRDAAFEYLLMGVEEDESSLSRAERKALIEAHRRHDPESAVLHYQMGLLLGEEDDFDGARRELAAALEKSGDDDESLEYRRALVELLHRQGRDAEAYQSIPPAVDTFQQLVMSYRWGEGTDGIENLKEIHRLHQAANPTDSWLDLCAAVIEKREKNGAEALRLAVQGFDHASDEMVKSQYRWLATELAVAEGDFAAAFHVIEKPDDALAQLGQRYSSAEDSEKLKLLLEWNGAGNLLKSPVWWFLKAQHAWNVNDFEEVVEAIRIFSSFPPRQDLRWKSQNLDDWHVRALLKLGRVDEAEQLARSRFEDEGKAMPLLLVQLVKKNVAEVEGLLAERQLHAYELNNLYEDPLTGPLLASAEFSPVRRQFPPSLPFSAGSPEAVLLLKNPAAVDSESLQPIAKSILGSETTVESLPLDRGASAAGVTGQWLVQCGSVRLVVASGTDLYHDPAVNRSGKLKSAALQQVLTDHRGWIEVGAAETPRGVSTWKRPLSSECQRLAAALLKIDGLALYLPDGFRLIEMTDELQAALVADNAQTMLATLGVSHWLSRASKDTGPAERKRDREFEKSLARLSNAVKTRRPEAVIEVAAVVRSSGAAEVLDFDIDRIEPGEFRELKLVGTLKKPSKLLPRLVLGDPLRIPENLVIGWSFTENGQTERARRGD